MSETRRTPELTRALEAAGGVNALARALGISSASVADWRRLPASRAKAVAELTGIPPHRLRPDLFDPPQPAPAPAQTAA